MGAAPTSVVLENEFSGPKRDFGIGEGLFWGMLVDFGGSFLTGVAVPATWAGLTTFWASGLLSFFSTDFTWGFGFGLSTSFGCGWAGLGAGCATRCCWGWATAGGACCCCCCGWFEPKIEPKSDLSTFLTIYAVSFYLGWCICCAWPGCILCSFSFSSFLSLLAWMRFQDEFYRASPENSKLDEGGFEILLK